MSCIASLVRETNADLFSPEFEFERDPALLVGEPVVADQHALLDGRTWVRVYLDGSALDDRGSVYRHGVLAAERLRSGDDALMGA